jgi:hypothetical protein
MTFAVELDKTPDPIHISLFGAQGIMFDPYTFPYHVGKPLFRLRAVAA